MDLSKRNETIKNIIKNIKLEKCNIDKKELATKIELGIYDFSVEYAQINDVESIIESGVAERS
jgi:hypothetical protein